MDNLKPYLTLTFILSNQILASFILILAFSLFIFLLIYNRRSSIGRSFSSLLACTCFTYAGDVALFQVTSLADAVLWLKFQWIGIAFTPAAYLHFSDALLRTTNDFSRIRRIAVMGSYALGGGILYLAIFTDLLVRDGFFYVGVTQLQAGPFFWLFTIYFYTTVISGGINTQRARSRCLTSATRRRMTYLMLSFAAPAFGVFPYMLLANRSSLLPSLLLLSTLFILNIGVALMIMFMGYNVVFFDAFTPDRVVRYTLLTFMLRGPLVASLVSVVILALPNQQIILGLPRDAILITSIVAIIVLSPIAANHLKAIVSRLIYHNELEEIEFLRYIDSRLLTTTDLRQALENSLTTICELLRVRTGFIANLAARTGPRLEASAGSAEAIETALSNFDPIPLNKTSNSDKVPSFMRQGDFLYVPLQTEARDRYLGLLGVQTKADTLDLSLHEQDMIHTLIKQAEFVLEDRHMQQNIFNTLRGIISDMERAQRVRNAVPYQDTSVETLLVENSLIDRPDFPKMVHEALTHYWGGPKLSNSPLLQLNIVREAMDTYDGNAVKALRSVLGQALESIRPQGEHRLTTSEWLFYNILELKFIQGLKVRDVAEKLAMSESDLYRKQRIAINAVADALSKMEKQETTR